MKIDEKKILKVLNIISLSLIALNIIVILMDLDVDRMLSILVLFFTGITLVVQGSIKSLLRLIDFFYGNRLKKRTLIHAGSFIFGSLMIVLAMYFFASSIDEIKLSLAYLSTSLFFNAFETVA